MRPIDPLAQHQANDLATTPEQLAQLLAAWPELDEAIARHPNAYDAMLGWIVQHGSPAAQQIAAQRVGPPPMPAQPQTPVQPQMPEQAQVPVQQGYAAQQGYPAQQLQGAPGAKRSRKGLVIALVAALVVVLGGGGFGIWALTRGPHGAESPEAVLSNMVKSIENHDLLALSSSIAPSEQRFMQDLLQATTKLQPTRTSPDLLTMSQQVIETLTVTENTLTTVATPITDDVVAVEITGGRLVIDADPETVADAIMQVAQPIFEEEARNRGASDEEIAEAIEQGREQAAQSLEESLPFTIDVDEQRNGTRIGYVAVNEGGWYLSPMLSAAENARALAFDDEESEPLGTTVYDAKRFGSATEAADGFFNGLADLFNSGGENIKSLAETLPLPERRLVSIYGPALFNPYTLGVERGAPEFVIDHVKGVEASGDGIVRLDLDMKATVTSDGYVGTFEIKDSCAWTFGDGHRGSGEREGGCLSDIPLLKNIGMDSAPLVVVNENGGWLVSPFATLTDYAARFAVAIQPCIQDSDLEDMCTP